MNKFSFLILLVFLSTFFSSFGQKVPIKFGKVTKEELEMTHYDLDSSANAVVLCDYGHSHIDYGTDGWILVFERTTRIKVLKKDGYEHANNSFTLYNRGGEREKNVSLKGATYNLESGKIVKTKLTNESIFEEEIDKKHDRVKFTLPNVKEGSVIEYSYKINSEFIFNYQGWQFQYEIPVVWSEYRAKSLEYFNYKMDFQGYIPAQINDVSSGTQSFNIRYDAKIDTSRPNITRTSGHTETYDARFTEKRMVLKDIPGFVSETNMTTKYDYLAMVSFELEYTQFPSSPIKRYRGTWVSLNQELLASEFLGKKVDNGIYLNSVVKELNLEQDSDEDKVLKIHNYIHSNVTWNGYYSEYSFNSFKKTIDDKKGSSADINLLLANMLNKAGIETEAVILSTRKNGMVKEFNATSSQFNNVVCYAKVGDSYVLLDATEKWLPAGILPEQCLNQRGYRLSENNHGWVELKSNSVRSTKFLGDLKLTPEGLNGTVTKSYDGYSALYKRKRINNAGQNDYEEDVINNAAWETENFEIENFKSLDKELKESYEVVIENQAEFLGNKVYLNAVISKPFNENPYKLEERLYPVSYSSLEKKVYYVTLEIPQGYNIVELPKNLRLALPNQGGMYTYSTSAVNNKVTILSNFEIKKNMFLPDEYPYLKAFYAQALSKMKEQIVLEKSN